MPPKADLEKALVGSRWAWGDAPLTLLADGQTRHTIWESSNLVTRWEAVDRRTVVLVIEKGRNSNRIAVLEFNELLDAFQGRNFYGRAMETRKRLPPAPK